MKLLSSLLILSTLTGALTRQADRSNSNSRLSPYQTWNTKRFPVWKEGDPRYKHSWTGGQLKFDVSNDAPTLTGAEITFTIDIVFPHTQRTLPDGRVVWAENYTVNGTQFRAGDPVYPEENSWNTVFPNAPLRHRSGDKPPPYVFVWKTWGKYWQVCDGPSSSLSVGTQDVPLGSYVMDVVIYHYRQKDRFIPIGYASTQFSITDQIPFTVSMTQVNDKDEADRKFVQNRAVAFSVELHDPSRYLNVSDVTFNWSFGDGSGTVISRERTVTHTYITSGAFRPQLVVQAAIPDPSCSNPPNLQTEGPTDESFTSEEPTQHIPAVKTAPPAPTNGSPARARVVKVKRDTPNDCLIYRYGSFSTDILIIEGIESVQIVHVAVADGFLLTDMEPNAVDFTISSQGSVPTEVCTSVSGVGCVGPVSSFCSAVSSSSDGQMVLRHFFSDSGIFCVNVSVANDVSLAVANARVNINIAGSRLTSVGVAALLLGIVTAASAMAAVVFAYKRLKGYQRLTEDPAPCKPNVMPALLWGLMNQPTAEQKKAVV